MTVLAAPEFDLCQPVEADDAPCVNQHRDLDAVADAERDLLEQRAARGELACQGLVEHRKLRRVQVEHRSREQLGHAPPTMGQQRAVCGKRALK